VKSRAFVFTLLEDVVFSSRAATEGGHRGLDRIPGSALLGAAAGRLYNELSNADRWTVFHSGQLRFTDALPRTSTGTVGLPAPACWLQEKHASIVTAERKLDPQQVRNGLHGRPQESVPFFSLRELYVGIDGSLARPRRRLRMKTAIDKSRGRAREAALFGYDALEAGQGFLGGVAADDGVEEHLFDEVCNAIEGVLRLGRSRGAEYGAVEAKRLDAAGLQSAPKPRAPVLRNRTVLWLLSDLLLEDRAAARVPELRLADLHPDLASENGRLVVEESFFTTRRIAAFNAFLGRPERDRAAIEAGSVLVFEEMDRQALSEVAEGGLGLEVQCGFGRVWVDPPLLAGERPQFESAAPCSGSVPEAEEQENPAAEDEYARNLRSFLKARHGARSRREEAERLARTWLKELPRLYRNGRNFAGKTAGDPIGPGSSQWGLVMTAARTENIDILRKRLEEICREGDPDWDFQVGPRERREDDQMPVTLREWLLTRIGEAGDRQADGARALGILASEARTRAEDWRHGRFGS